MKNNNLFLSSPFLSLNFSLFHDKIVVRVIRLRSAEQTANGKIFSKLPKLLSKKTQIFVQKSQKIPFFILHTYLFVHLSLVLMTKNLKLDLSYLLLTNQVIVHQPSTICMSNCLTYSANTMLIPKLIPYYIFLESIEVSIDSLLCNC